RRRSPACSTSTPPSSPSCPRSRWCRCRPRRRWRRRRLSVPGRDVTVSAGKLPSAKMSSMTEIPIETLRERLDEYLERARQGERIFITEQGRSVAQLVPAEESRVTQRAWELVKAGVAHWGGGKPEGSRQRPRLRGGKSASDI